MGRDLGEKRVYKHKTLASYVEAIFWCGDHISLTALSDFKCGVMEGSDGFSLEITDHNNVDHKIWSEKHYVVKTELNEILIYEKSLFEENYAEVLDHKLPDVLTRFDVWTILSLEFSMDRAKVKQMLYGVLFSKYSKEPSLTELLIICRGILTLIKVTGRENAVIPLYGFRLHPESQL